MERINGDILKQALADKGFKQFEFAEKTGISKFRISRLCQEGMHNVYRQTAENIADALNIELAELRKENGVYQGKPARQLRDMLSEDAIAVLDMYDKLDPVGKAEVLLKIKAITDEMAEKGD